LTSPESLTSKLEDLYATEVNDEEEENPQGVFSTPVSQLMNLARRIQNNPKGSFWSKWKN
jgi:hypothetical protein